MSVYTPLYPTLYSKTGVRRGIHIFLIFAPNIDCGYMYSLEPPRPQAEVGLSDMYLAGAGLEPTTDTAVR